MNKICTTIEQSKKLIELGMDVKTADMDYVPCVNDMNEYDYVVNIWNNEHEENWIPCWSLTALLGLMPKVISIMVSEDAAYRYELEWQFANDNSIRYVGSDRKCLIDIYSDHDDDKWKDLIDTAFQMVVWLKENNKI